jgi:hypothetical protein
MHEGMPMIRIYQALTKNEVEAKNIANPKNEPNMSKTEVLFPES